MHIQFKAAIFVGAWGRSQTIPQPFKPMETLNLFFSWPDSIDKLLCDKWYRYAT